jgi:hypothetical protein
MLKQALAINPELDVNKDIVLTKALMNAGKELGIGSDILAKIVGKNRSSLYRADGIKADSKNGELALIFIRCYRALYVLMGGNEPAMKHWINTPNKHTGGTPLEQVIKLEGLMTVMRYLDAIRGKN